MSYIGTQVFSSELYWNSSREFTLRLWIYLTLFSPTEIFFWNSGFSTKRVILELRFSSLRVILELLTSSTTLMVMEMQGFSFQKQNKNPSSEFILKLIPSNNLNKSTQKSTPYIFVPPPPTSSILDISHVSGHELTSVQGFKYSGNGLYSGWP